MKVRDVMTYGVETIQAEDTVQKAAERMADKNVGALPVYSGSVIDGLVTDRDITIKVIAKGLEPAKTKVREVMSSGIDFCTEDQDIEDAARIMEELKVRRLAVFDRQWVLVGLISLSDLAARAHNKELVEGVLETIGAREVEKIEDDYLNPFYGYEGLGDS